MRRLKIKFILINISLLIFLLYVHEVFAQFPLSPPGPPQLIINVSYSEPTDDHSISIYVDGKLSEAPVIENLTYGTHSLKCVKAGYFDYEEEINFPEKLTVVCMMAKTTTLSIKVKDSSGERIGAKVYLDDKFQGIIDVGSFPVSKGTHAVKCSKEGYEDFSESVNIEKHIATREGSFYNIECILKPLSGTYVAPSYVPTPTPIPKPKGFFAGFLMWFVGIIKELFVE